MQREHCERVSKAVHVRTEADLLPVSAGVVWRMPWLDVVSFRDLTTLHRSILLRFP